MNIWAAVLCVGDDLQAVAKWLFKATAEFHLLIVSTQLCSEIEPDRESCVKIIDSLKHTVIVKRY